MKFFLWPILIIQLVGCFDQSTFVEDGQAEVSPQDGSFFVIEDNICLETHFPHCSRPLHPP